MPDTVQERIDRLCDRVKRDDKFKSLVESACARIFYGKSTPTRERRINEEVGVAGAWACWHLFHKIDLFGFVKRSA